MAHEPKLQVFKIYLKPKSNNNNNSLREVFKQKFAIDENDLDDDNVFRQVLQDVVSTIDTGYFLNERRKKGIGIEKNTDGTTNVSIQFSTDKSVIKGIVQGGRYGQDRSVGDITDSDTRDDLKKENIVLDKFYFLLYLPLNSDKAVAMVHSYTDDSISDIFSDWMKDILFSQGFFIPAVIPYSPKSIKDEFISKSFIKEFKYKRDILISEIDAIDTIETKDWTVEVIIRAKEEGVNVGKLQQLSTMFKKVILKSKRKEFKLEEFNNQTAQLNDGRHQNSFKIGDKIDIQPTIYLREKISLQSDDTPNWNELEDFCFSLLEEIIPEVYPENNEIS